MAAVGGLTRLGEGDSLDSEKVLPAELAGIVSRLGSLTPAYSDASPG